MRIVNVIKVNAWDEEAFFEELLPFCQHTGTTGMAYFIHCAPQRLPLHAETRQALNRFARCRAILKPAGIEAGLCITTIGFSDRGMPIDTLPFQQMTGVDGVSNPAAICPLDVKFQDYIAEAITLLAEAEPDFIMVDDDFNVDAHDPLKMACTCPLHLQLYKEMYGREETPQSLFEKLTTPSNERETMSREWYEVQTASLRRFARAIRRAIDTVDPDIRGGACIGQIIWPSVPELLPILGGAHSPRVRLKSSMYMSDDRQVVSRKMDQMRMQLKEYPAEFECLSEADTCPHNRYSISATTLGAYITGSLLVGADGILLWIVNTRNWNTEDRKVYADYVHDKLPFFRAAEELAKNVRWEGPCSLYSMRSLKRVNWHSNYTKGGFFPSGWHDTLHVLGIPYTFHLDSRVKMLTSNAVEGFTRDELEAFLSQGGLLLDGGAADRLSAMGFSRLIGIEVRGRRTRAQYEEFTGHAINSSAVGTKHLCSMSPGSSGTRCLAVIDERVEIASRFVNVARNDQLKTEDVSPALTLFTNDRGARVAVYATTFAEAGAGFPSLLGQTAFRSEERKQQLSGLLAWLDGGKMLSGVVWSGVDTLSLCGIEKTSGDRILAVHNMSFDRIDPLVTQFEEGCPTSAQVLAEDGSWREVTCREAGNRTVFNVGIETMKWLLLRLKFGDRPE